MYDLGHLMAFHAQPVPRHRVELRCVDEIHSSRKEYEHAWRRATST